MKTLDQAVIELNGVLPHKITMAGHAAGVGAIINYFGKIKICGDELDICTEYQFQQRAKELGFVGKYRWGVVYETDGKRPELTDDVVVECGLRNEFKHRVFEENKVSEWRWDFKCHGTDVLSFKITDQRYKPADTSYLEKTALEPVPEGEGWYDYDNQKALRLPPVGEKVQLKHKQAEQGIAELISCRDDEVVWWNVDGERFQHDKARHYEFKPLDHDRKAKAERKKVVDAAFDEAIKAGCVDFSQWLSHLYDKGFLKLPE